jgi:hypothetical protein
MAITTNDGLIAAIAAGQMLRYNKASMTTVAGRFFSLWKVGGQPAAGSDPGNTTTGVIPTDATAGAFPYTNPGGGLTGYLSRWSAGGAQVGTMMVYDRLWHGGAYTSINGNISTSTTTAINRYSTGANCEAWLEVATALSATATTITLTYVNQDGTGGRTATATALASAIQGSMFKFDLQAGDTGIRQITNIAGSAAPTGTLNVLIIRPLLEIPIAIAGLFNVMDAIATGLPVVENDACLGLMFFANTTSSGAQAGGFSLISG